MKMLNQSIVPETTKWAFTTRRVNRSDVKGISHDIYRALPGDLVLAEVSEINQHRRIQLTHGRGSVMYLGDLVVLACGDRYAPDQFEGRAQLSLEGSDLLAGGGLIGKAYQAHANMRECTRLRPIGLLTDKSGDVINIGSYALPDALAMPGITVIGVVGTSMNAGKTTATASFAHGLSKAGFKVAAIKATGTGAFGDFNAMTDAGVDYVGDFTDAGMGSTYHQPIERIEQGFKNLIADAARQGVDIAVVELADGIFQKETAALLRSSTVIREAFDGIMFAAADAVSVVGGVAILRGMGFEPLAASGKISLSPLATAEAKQETGIDIFTREELMSSQIAKQLLSNLFRGAEQYTEVSA